MPRLACAQFACAHAKTKQRPARGLNRWEGTAIGEAPDVCADTMSGTRQSALLHAGAHRSPDFADPVKNPLKSFLYVSQLATEFSADCVSDIVKTAREFNPVHDITGVLVFDGERFAQYIEGAPAAIDALADNLKRDKRHTDFSVLHVNPEEDVRQLQKWAMGYCDPDAEHLDIEALGQLSGARACAFFMEHVAKLEIV